MLLDQNAILSDNQKVVANTLSQNTLDLGAAGNTVLGALFAVCQVAETFAGAASVKITLETAPTADFQTPVELFSATFEGETLKMGKTLFALAVPAGLLRYVRANYAVKGTGTAGALSCFFTNAVDLK